MLENLRQRLTTLPIFKKGVLLLTAVFFVLSLFFSILAASAYLNSGQPLSPKGGAVSPLGYFGETKKEVPEVTASPKTVPSPLNGVLFTEEEAKEWGDRRPMAVMINNHPDARPQWGLSQADIIYEAVAEGGISRFLAIFHGKIPDKVGPVRSARRYYVDWVKENDAWYAHWGGASTANEANVYDYMRKIYVSSIDVPSIGPNEPFDRDSERLKRVAIEHTGLARLPLVYETAYRMYPDQPRQLAETQSWKFKDDLNPSQRPSGGFAEFNFWDLPEFLTRWDYEAQSNSYLRTQGGVREIDAVSGEGLRAKVVAIVFMLEVSLGDEKSHLLYTTVGRGDAKVLLDGKVIEAVWSRPNVRSRTRFFDKNGLEIAFNRGQIWIEILPTGDSVTYN